MVLFQVEKEIKTLRMGAGYSQEYLADYFNTTASSICKMEKGNTRIDSVVFLNWIKVCAVGPVKIDFEQNEFGFLQPV